MPDTPKLRQLSNSQTQAGAAAQLIVNIFLVSTGDGAWVVKPIAFHTEGAVSLGDRRPGDEERAALGVEAQARLASNAQGQGLTVINDVKMLDVLERAIGLAAEDPEIQQALRAREVTPRG